MGEKAFDGVQYVSLSDSSQKTGGGSCLGGSVMAMNEGTSLGQRE